MYRFCICSICLLNWLKQNILQSHFSSSSIPNLYFYERNPFIEINTKCEKLSTYVHTNKILDEFLPLFMFDDVDKRNTLKYHPFYMHSKYKSFYSCVIVLYTSNITTSTFSLFDFWIKLWVVKLKYPKRKVIMVTAILDI